MGFVINLISKNGITNINNYGYWTGKQYMVNGEYYPICRKYINNETKIYKHKKVAERSAQSCLEKFGYVTNVEVEEIL